MFNTVLNNLNKNRNRLLIKRYIKVLTMACSRYEYVKNYETDDKLIPNCWIVVRLDGKGFHKFSKIHDFNKPNDKNALNLMNQAAVTVMEEFRDIIIGYGQSDEYSFVLKKDCNLYNRRSAKIMSNINSLFTSSYVYNWSTSFPHKKLEYPPCFDARIVLYPSDENLKDYLSWRQADVHVNNLYNTTFWNLVLKGGLTNTQAEAKLRGTFAADKNEILFKEFNINYNKELPMFRKGTILLRKHIEIYENVKRQLIVPIYDDLIREKFWTKHYELLYGEKMPTDNLEKEDTDLLLAEIVIKQIEKIKLN